MANPAVLLFNTLRQWNPPNISVETMPQKLRGLDANRDHAFRMHEIAIGYIGQIRELLDTLEQTAQYDVDEYRRELPNWTAMIMAYPKGWQQAEPFDNNSLRFLKTLGPMLDNLVPEYSDEQIEMVDGGLREVLRLLSEDKSIDKALAQYILNLTNHVAWVIRDVRVQGDFQLARAATMLREALRTADDSSTREDLKPWYKRLMEVIFTPQVVPKVIDLSLAATKALNELPPAH